MRIHCPHCQRSFDAPGDVAAEDRLLSGAASVACGRCGKTIAQLRWLVRDAAGQVVVFNTPALLKIGILAGQVTGTDQISRAGRKWLTVESIPELAMLFGRSDGPLEALEPASVIESLPEGPPSEEPESRAELPPLPGDAGESTLFVRPARTRALAVGIAALVAAAGLALVWWAPWTPSTQVEPSAPQASAAAEPAPTPEPVEPAAPVAPTTPEEAPEVEAPAPEAPATASPAPGAPVPAVALTPEPAAPSSPPTPAEPAPSPAADPALAPAPVPVPAPAVAPKPRRPSAPAPAAEPSTIAGWITLGDRWLDRDAQKALNAYLHAYSQDPYRPDVLTRLGDVFTRQGNLPKAIQHYQRALQASSSFGPAYVGLAEALRLSGNVDEARRTLQTYLERFPSGSLRTRVEALLQKL